MDQINQHLSAEIDELDHHLDQLVAVAAPALVAIKGVGTDIASTLLTIAYGGCDWHSDHERLILAA
jgi:hypothetical protein